MSDSRHDLAMQHYDIVDEVLTNFLHKNGWADPYKEDLNSAGLIALLEAGQEWPGGESFRGWARNRIVWAMMDEATLLAESERSPTEGRKRQPRPMLSLDLSAGPTPESHSLAEVLPDPTDFAENTYRDIMRDRLREILQDVLTPAEWISFVRVFGLLDGQPMSFTAAAEVEGISRQALTERVKRGVARLAEEHPEIEMWLE